MPDAARVLRLFAMNRTLLGAVLAATSLLALVGCAADAPQPSPSGTIAVVASTDVYGDIAAQIGGDLVSVTSIIDNPNQDPHEFEADARSQLALSKAQVVIENGAGYDPFVDTMLGALGDSTAARLVVAELAAPRLDQSAADFNEHLWYDLPTMAALARALVDEYSTLLPEHKADFSTRGDTFLAKVTALEEQTTQMAALTDGAGVLVTEPLPLYLTQAAGLLDKTPAAFARAMEDGTDVSPVVLKDVLQLVSSGQVAVVVYNEQTSNAQTEQVLKAAGEAGVPVVAMTETLPAGTDYLGWMADNVSALATALGR